MKIKYIWELEDIKKCGCFVNKSKNNWKGSVWKIGFIHIGPTQYFTRTNILTDGFTIHSTAEDLLHYCNMGDGAEPISIEEAVKLYGENPIKY